MSALAAIILAALLQVVSPPDPPVVLLLRATDSEPLMAEALARVRGELAAMGFAVRERELEETVGWDDAAPVAAIALRMSADRAAIEVSQTRRPDGARAAAPTVHRIELDGVPAERAPTVLAVRASEVVRTFLEPIARPAPAAAATVQAQAPPPPPTRRWRIDVRAAWLAGPGGAAAVPAPWLRIERSLLRGRAAELGVAAWGTTAARSRSIDEAPGRARLDQSLAGVELALRLRPQARVQPLFGVAGGAYRVAGRGEASEAAWVGDQAVRWAAAGLVSAGASVALGARVELLAQASLVALAPRPAVLFDHQTIARVSTPTWLATVGVAVRP